jgi:hypothetical protein
MKAQEDGTVIQRFCIAILQKMSVKEDAIPIYMKSGLIDWIIKLLQRSRISEIHIFCLDFASALLANILHSNITLEYLEKNSSICKNVICINPANRNLFSNDKGKYTYFCPYAYSYLFVLFIEG